MRYEIHHTNNMGRVIAERQTEKAAIRYALKHAHEHHFGLVVFDTKTGRVYDGEWSEPGQEAQP